MDTGRMPSKAFRSLWPNASWDWVRPGPMRRVGLSPTPGTYPRLGDNPFDWVNAEVLGPWRC